MSQSQPLELLYKEKFCRHYSKVIAPQGRHQQTYVGGNATNPIVISVGSEGKAIFRTKEEDILVRLPTLMPKEELKDILRIFSPSSDLQLRKVMGNVHLSLTVRR